MQRGVKITVRCFAAVRELLGRETLELEVPAGTTIEGLRMLLAERAPALRDLPVACAVNRDYVAAQRELREGDEVALIPPISGGAGGSELFRIDLCDGPLDPRPLEAEVRTDADGAVVTFAGVTRDHNEGRAVERLSYEAYAEMVSKVMVGIFEEAVKRFALTRARVAHRLGEVPVGETSVLVVVSAVHRAAAFDACRFLMDRVKAQVPIFKKETLGGGGGSRWVGDLPGA
jgi:molybdopterin synthase catalytic subunit